MANVGEVSVGDKVTTTATHDVNGTSLASFVRTTTYDVIQVGGDGLPDTRIVIGLGSAVTAAVDISTLTIIGGSKSIKSEDTPKVEYKEYAMTSKGIEDYLTNMLKNSIPIEMMKYTMRLFGLPSQFTGYCDYRTFSAPNRAKSTQIGRKFIENIMMEAPVVTIIPGKPAYLPAAKNKRGLSYSLLSAANRDVSSIFSALKGEKNMHEKLRYYDFQQDYLNYMRYVNILCAVSAAFLDLNETKLDGVPLIKYNWQNYRWTGGNYSTATANILTASKNALESAVETLKVHGKEAMNKIFGTKFDTGSKITAFDDKEEEQSFVETMEEVLRQVNFVQFYVDASSGLSESADNETSTSKIEGMMSSGSELLKEVSFIANSAGVDNYDEFLESVDSGVDVMNSMLLDNGGTMSGIMSRLTSTATNVIKGDNFVFPEIYQRSRFNKQYSIIIDLRAPYGNKLSYYMNVLVPLFHLLALAIPKQSTANTYGSPFLIKAYYPGVFACNLGIVQQITIDKNSSGDSWTVDGFPNEIKVTLNIVDLYSDLSMTPSGDIVLFLSNSSLIEYIATACGINLVTPQLQNRLTTVITVVKQSFENIIEDTVNIDILGGLENKIASMTGLQ